MTRRAQTIVTMAAGLIFSSSIVLSQAQSGGSRESGMNQTPSGQSSQSAAGSAPLNTDARAGMSGQDADQQVNQQLSEIAKDPKTAADKLFVLHAGMGNQFEVELARQAEKKASNPQVKQVAQQIRQDHEKASQQLQQAAQQLGVQLPKTLPQSKQQEIQILASLPTEEFEKHYICKMQADHAKDIIEYRATAQNAKNDQVKRYAQSQIPALAMHNSHVQQAAVALGLPRSDSNGSDAMPASGRIEGSGSGNRPDGSSGSSGASGTSGGPSGNSNSAGSAGSSMNGTNGTNPGATGTTGGQR